MFISNYSLESEKFTCIVSSKIINKCFKQIDWEKRGVHQYISEERYGVRQASRLAKSIAKVLNIKLGKDQDIGIVESRTGGIRVIIRHISNFIQALELYKKKVLVLLDQEKVAALVEQIKTSVIIKATFSIPEEVKRAEALLNDFCSGVWYENDAIIGKTLSNKFKCLHPCCNIAIRPIQKGNYLITAYSYYIGKTPKKAFATLEDINFILEKLKDR